MLNKNHLTRNDMGGNNAPDFGFSPAQLRPSVRFQCFHLIPSPASC